MIFITGATGHIGNNLVRVFIEHQTPCRLLLRRLGPALDNLDIDYVIGDIFDPAFLKQHIQPKDTLIHVAGVIDLTAKYRLDSDKVNVEGTKIIANFCAENDVTLIYVSSVDCINKPSRNALIHEPNNFHIETIKSHYAKAKAQGTAYVLHLINQNTLKGAIVYPSAVIGIHDYKPSAAGNQMMIAYKRRILPYIKGGYNFIDVRDVAAALYHIVTKPILGSFILSAHEVTIKEFYQVIARFADHRKWIIPVPNFLAKFGALFLKSVSNVMIDAVEENYHYDHSRMKSELHIEPRSFEATVQDTIEWFKNKRS
jgi:dihydroflavonol-4-reductase